MQINNYTKKIILICAALIITIIGLSFVLYSQGPKVRFIQGADDVRVRALTSDSNLQIVFDRPIEQRDYSEFISIAPDIAFTAQTNTQSITLTLKANLLNNADYTVSLRPEVHDQSGKRMKDAYSYTFATPQSSYMYLERNYGLDLDSDVSLIDEFSKEEDHIMLSTFDEEPEIMFSHSRIRSFAANNEYLVVVVIEETSDELYSINLDTKEVRHEQQWSKSRINDLALSPRSKTALFTTQPEFESVSPEYYKEFENRIKSIDLDDGTITGLTDGDDTPLKAYSIDTDIDGQIALIQDAQQAYYAVSPFNDFDPVLVGTYSETFGFSQGGSEILFRDNIGLVRYDIASAQTVPIEPDGRGYILDVKSLNNTINYSSATYSIESSYSSVQTVADWDSEPSITWRSTDSDTTTLQKFSPSYDNSLLALQFTPEMCQYDDVGVNSECKDVFQHIIDSETGTVIEEYRGSSVVWLP